MGGFGERVDVIEDVCCFGDLERFSGGFTIVRDGRDGEWVGVGGFLTSFG